MVPGINVSLFGQLCAKFFCEVKIKFKRRLGQCVGSGRLLRDTGRRTTKNIITKYPFSIVHSEQRARLDECGWRCRSVIKRGHRTALYFVGLYLYRLALTYNKEDTQPGARETHTLDKHNSSNN